MRIWMQALAVLAVVGAVPAAAQTALQRQVDAYVAPLVATRNFSGVVLVARGDTVLVQQAYGLASQELGAPNRLDNRFQIASASKPITAAAVLKLAERGKLDLQAPISQILPDYPNGEHITVHQLLSHTSGIPDVNQLPVYSELGLKRRSTAELVAAFKDARVSFAPGTAQAYSNSNYELLALIVEKVSGQSYGAFLQQEIFGPLRMTRSGHRGDAGVILDGMTNGYVPTGRTDLARPAWFDWTVKTGNGSLYATAADLHRFLRGYFGGRVLTPAMQQAATTPVKGPMNYGYGWMAERHLERARLSHPGSSPGYASQLAYYPDDQLSVVVLSNISVSTTGPVADAVAAMALGRPHESLTISDAPVAPRVSRPVVGTYQFGPDFRAPNMKLNIVEDGGRLSMSANIPGFPAGPLFARGPLRYIDRSYWADVTFEAGPDGQVTGLTFAALGYRFKARRLP